MKHLKNEAAATWFHQILKQGPCWQEGHKERLSVLLTFPLLALLRCTKDFVLNCRFLHPNPIPPLPPPFPLPSCLPCWLQDPGDGLGFGWGSLFLTKDMLNRLSFEWHCLYFKCYSVNARRFWYLKYFTHEDSNVKKPIRKHIILWLHHLLHEVGNKVWRNVSFQEQQAPPSPPHSMDLAVQVRFHVLWY